MSRTRGAKAADHEARRAALLAAMHDRLVAPDLAPPSLRELAAAAGVTLPRWHTTSASARILSWR